MTATTQALPAHDPATWRSMPTDSRPVDPGRVQRLLAAEWERFTSWSRGSAEHNQRTPLPPPLPDLPDADRPLTDGDTRI